MSDSAVTPGAGVFPRGAAKGAARRLPAPFIDPVPDDVGRPFWSVMIPTYNGTDYLREALASVLRQDPGPDQMQIELVDNCSTRNDPEIVAREIGGGRVACYRQPSNVGAIENFNTCIRRARGHWVHILHDDDFVLPGYYERFRQGILAHPEIGAVACRIIYMDGDGHWTGLTELETRTTQVLDEDFVDRQLLNQVIQYVGMVVRRSTYEELGGFRPELARCADWDMWKRVAAGAKILYEPEPLACYREHPGADSARWIRAGQNVAQERHSIEVTCAELPPDKAREIYRAAMREAAIRAIRSARYQWECGNRGIALRQAWEAMRTSQAPAVLARLVQLAGWTAARSRSAPRQRRY